MAGIALAAIFVLFASPGTFAATATAVSATATAMMTTTTTGVSNPINVGRLVVTSYNPVSCTFYFTAHEDKVGGGEVLYSLSIHDVAGQQPTFHATATDGWTVMKNSVVGGSYPMNLAQTEFSVGGQMLLINQYGAQRFITADYVLNAVGTTAQSACSQANFYVGT